MSNQPRICVVGSSNYDLTAYTNRFPKPGETVLGYNFKMGCGGKGANQAVAAAKLGADVTIVTKLGDDIFGQQTFQNYKNLNINTDFVSMTNETHSGVAPIWVDKKANNSIIVISGANDLMQIEDIESARSAIESAQILICQNEIPFHITQKALQIAKNVGVCTFFNSAPAPEKELSDDFCQLIDILCLNETESELLTKIKVRKPKDAIRVGEFFVQKGIKKVIVTLGAKGCVFITNDFAKWLKSYKVKAVDTSGAGDCFVGSFAYFYAKGADVLDAISKAQYMASRSVQKLGTQSSYPSAHELLNQ